MLGWWCNGCPSGSVTCVCLQRSDVRGNLLHLRLLLDECHNGRLVPFNTHGTSSCFTRTLLCLWPAATNSATASDGSSESSCIQKVVSKANAPSAVAFSASLLCAWPASSGMFKHTLTAGLCASVLHTLLLLLFHSLFNLSEANFPVCVPFPDAFCLVQRAVAL